MTGHGDHGSAAAGAGGVPGIIRLLGQAARSFATRTAFIAGGRRLSYAEAHRRLLALAGDLTALAAPGDRVVIVMHNSVDAALLPLAVRAAGLVSVPVNWRMSALELANVVAASEAGLLIHDEALAGLAAAALDRLPAARTRAVRADRLGGGAPPLDPAAAPEADEEALASIHFTSGTLGTPKGVMHGHRHWEMVWRNLMSVRDFRPGDVAMLTGPLSHAAGTYVVPLLLSGAAVLLPGSLAPEALAGDCAQFRPTVLQTVPTLLTRLVGSTLFCNAARPSLRLIIYGAEAMPHGTLLAAVERFGPIIAQNYGLTEAMMTCATLSPEEHALVENGRPTLLRHGIVGRPYPFVELVLRAPDGRPVEEGAIGEITIRSPHVMQGYWRNPAATAQALRHGWLWSGDLGRWTEDGYLAMAGRAKDMIITGGMNIYPAEVQAFVSAFPGVRQCAAFGVSSAAWGEELVAAVVLDEDTPAAREALKTRARADLGIRTPKTWLFADELPRTGNGKIDFAALKLRVPEAAA